MGVAQDGSRSRSKSLRLPRRSKWSISRHGCENARLISPASASTSRMVEGRRACDKAARKLLGQPRGSSVFPAPCRPALGAQTYAEASSINRQKTTRGLSQQAWGIAPKIKQVDDAITSECQRWAFEVHPKVCFWALNQRRPMARNKKTKEGAAERLFLLRRVFPQVETHLANRPRGIGADDLLDAAAAAWTALRWYRNEAECVCTPEHDEKGLAATIYY